jgi:antitoxin component YwqK of YwqJK toxin-antitoxin module
MIKVLNKKSQRMEDGKWKEFNKHAVLISEGNYINGKKHGTWREYYDHTGSIMIEENYNNGIAHGRYRSFHPNGRVWSEGQFVNGMRENYFSVYDENGMQVRSMLFIHNKQIEDVEIKQELHETAGRQAG